ncbi:GtrA family protein [Candidatus Dojkabacteria bacterium]|nr:GtrA family protein [Candidatus Dojkabacteria bacterium]
MKIYDWFIRDYEIFGRKIKKDFVEQLFKYVVVGTSGFLLNYGLYWICLNVFKMKHEISGYIITPIGLYFIFIMNKIWSFKGKEGDKKNSTKQMIRYLILVVANSLINTVMMNFFYESLNLSLLIARAICTAIPVVWNFFLYKYWIYKE